MLAASAAARFSPASVSVARSRCSAAARSSLRALTCSSWRCRLATRRASAPLASREPPGSSTLATMRPPPLAARETGPLLLLLALLPAAPLPTGLMAKPERPRAAGAGAARGWLAEGEAPPPAAPPWLRK